MNPNKKKLLLSILDRSKPWDYGNAHECIGGHAVNLDMVSYEIGMSSERVAKALDIPWDKGEYLAYDIRSYWWFPKNWFKNPWEREVGRYQAAFNLLIHG